MRFPFLKSLLILSTLFSVPLAYAQEGELEELIEPVEPLPAPKTKPAVDEVPLAQKPPLERMEALFDQLKKTQDERLARPIAENIWGEWYRSGSATTDLMMEWAKKAMANKQNNVAMDYLDQVILRAPDYAEGFNRRATLHYQMSNFMKSMADISRTLEIEPRHFGAWTGMAAILETTGRKQEALKAWQKAAEIYPAMSQAQEAIIRLSEELADDPA